VGTEFKYDFISKYRNKLSVSYGIFLVGSKCSFKEIKISVQLLLVHVRELLE
jgi:hypothetical protein